MNFLVIEEYDKETFQKRVSTMRRNGWFVKVAGRDSNIGSMKVLYWCMIEKSTKKEKSK